MKHNKVIESIPLDPLSSFSKKPVMSEPGYYADGAASPYEVEFGRPNREFFEDRKLGESPETYIKRRIIERPELLEKLLKYGLDPNYPLDQGWEQRTGRRPEHIGSRAIKAVQTLFSRN